MGNIHTVGPNEALIVSGGCFGSTTKKTIVGGWGWAWWLVTDVQRISLEVMTLNPMCEYVETAQGVPLTVTGVAQCKIMNEDELLTTACEQFLGKSVKEIKMTILQTLEGHLRAILGTLTVEEVYKDRDQFAGLVREVAAPDVGRMGIEILSFTIKDVYDEVQYLQSLGKAQTAAVKRDADVGVAQANRDAGIREAECEKSAMDVKYSMDTRIEDNTRMFKLQKAQFDQEVNTAKAEAALAYELQAAKIKQKIRNEEIQIEIVERRKQIEVEQMEILRREEELVSTVRLPAEAEAYRLQAIAEGKRTQTVEGAKADAERIKVLGLAEALAIGDVGKADAERMLAKAKVYKQYGDAALMALVLEALPKIAAEVSAPLAKTDEIVLVGDNGATGEVARLVGGLPPALKTLTGLDLTAVLKRLHPATGGSAPEPPVVANSTKKVAAC
ncbi:flotillin-2 isoform X2 [Cydia amplana]|uniref:flotillin-2 isoform X2 n=1 Tax=Cydia amplana TaxID=1869771 RepID=UPI002FE6B3A7